MVEKCLANRRIIKKMQGRGDGEKLVIRKRQCPKGPRAYHNVSGVWEGSHVCTLMFVRETGDETVEGVREMHVGVDV